MEIQLRLYGSSKILSDKETLNIQLPNNSNIEKLRNILTKIISEKHFPRCWLLRLSVPRRDL